MSRTKGKPSGPTNQKPVRKTGKSSKQKSSKKTQTLFERIDFFLDARLNKIFWISFGLTLLFGLLLFDIRISTSGDDSAYIIRSAEFIHHFVFPGFQGPLYPIVLSPFVLIFGIKVVPLKLFSLLSILGCTYFTYKAFKGRIPALLMTGLLFLVSVNSFILYYASQTYSEAFFMFLQALTLFVFFKLFIDTEEETSFMVFLRNHLFLALCLLGLGLTRSIGFAAVFATGGYFLLKSQWKNLLGFLFSFMLLIALYELLKYIVWGNSDLNFTVQAQSLMAKDYYNPEMGKENLMGFVHRFVTNSNLFFSKYLYTILGLRAQDESFVYHPLVTILTYLMLVATGIVTIRKNRYLFFTAIYVLVFLFSTFLIAHTVWGQSRFIIPYVSLILLVVLELFYFILSYKKISVLQWILPVIIVLLFISAMGATIPRVAAARKVTDKYYGLNPDWMNYCRVSEWASVNLPKDALVACRKPSISFIYGNGRNFYGITKVVSYPGDSILMNWQKNRKQYYLISTSAINSTHLSKRLYTTFTRNIVGCGVIYKGMAYYVKYYIMDFADSIKTKTLDELSKVNINVISDYDSLKIIMNDPGSKFAVVYPDSLLMILFKAKVTHVLTASLRANPDRKTNQISNTVERFMSFIEFKYPRIRTKIIQIGEDNDEPASIYKLNYEYYGLR